jgi:hypothetical protein
MRTHADLRAVCTATDDDYAPYGTAERGDAPDCSWGCRWAVRLAGALGADWLVCANPRSHRRGLLTFEHQGCGAFEAGG